MADAGGGYNCGSSELVAMLFFGYCLIIAFIAVAMWLVGSFNNATLEKHYHPRPPIDQTVTAAEINRTLALTSREGSVCGEG